jgi:hypothetical protein
LIMFNEFPSLRDYVFTRTNLWLKPTSEKWYNKNRYSVRYLFFFWLFLPHFRW